MDEHRSQNQSFTVTMNFTHQSCWYCCLWPAEGTFLNLAPICHLFRGRGKKPSGSTNSFRCPSTPPVFTTSHLAILGSKIFDRRSARHRLHYLRNFLSQYNYRHFVLAQWRADSWEVRISLYFMEPEFALLCSKDSHLSQARTRWIQSSSSHSCTYEPLEYYPLIYTYVFHFYSSLSVFD